MILIDDFAGSRRPDKAKPPSGNYYVDANLSDAESKKPNLAVGFF
jgi:hypothetical protein